MFLFGPKEVSTEEVSTEEVSPKKEKNTVGPYREINVLLKMIDS